MHHEKLTPHLWIGTISGIWDGWIPLKTIFGWNEGGSFDVCGVQHVYVKVIYDVTVPFHSHKYAQFHSFSLLPSYLFTYFTFTIFLKF